MDSANTDPKPEPGDSMAYPDTQHIEHDLKDPPAEIKQHNAELYAEALRRYPNDESIDKEDERRLRRRIDRRILPLLGFCYFFYVSFYWNP